MVILFFTINSANAQLRNSIWCFGDSAGVDFRDITNPLPFNSVMDGRGSCVSIADSLGNLQFYANTYGPLFKTIVWNANNDTLLDGSEGIIAGGFYNEQQIIPFPDSISKYYLITNGAFSLLDGLYYSVIDMALDQGRGGVTSKHIQISSDTIADCVQVLKHANGRDWWLISKKASQHFTHYNRFIVFLITPDGISAPINYDFNDATDIYFQKIIFNSEGTKIMCVNLRGYMCEFNFDRCTGIINNPLLIYPEITVPPSTRLFWEGSYSPNDQLFYCSTNRSNNMDQSYLIQYDLTASNVSSTADTLDNTLAPIGPGAIRLAPDNKIYYSRAYESPGVNSFPYADSMFNYINMNLSVINEPNQLGSACNFQPFSFNLGGKRTYYSLPNNPQYDLGPVIGSVCDSLLNIVEDRNFEDIKVKVFPNPFSKSITIHSLSISDVELNLYNNLGSLLLTKKFRENIQLVLSFLASGTYHLELISEKSVVIKKIVKTD